MAVHYIDCLGDMCPTPVLKVEAMAKELPVGDVIVVETDHSCTPITISSLMKKRGFKTTVKEVETGVWQVTLKKIK